MHKLVIFDFDDTLLHLNVKWLAVYSEVARLALARFTVPGAGEHLVSLGNRLAKDPETKRRIDAIYLKYENECADGKAYTVYPDMAALVRDIKSSGRKLAIASGNHTSVIKRILAEISPGSEFDMVLGRDMVQHNKPSPDQLIIIMSALGALKSETIFIGDSVFDEEAALGAGVDFIRLPKGPDKGIPMLRRKLGLP